MNLHHVDIDDLADIIGRSVVLRTQDGPAGLVVRVVEYAGGDALLIQEPITGAGIVIESLDTEYGGSIHQHVRDALAAPKR